MSDAFLEVFRGSAPYIHKHRDKTMVVAASGDVVRSAGRIDLASDIALMLSLGIRVVLVVGARPQIDARAKERGITPTFVDGTRVTDAASMRCVREAVGANRIELESLFSTSLPRSPMAGARVRVISGNFVLARPIGVREGIDYQFTGRVRRIDEAGLREQLERGHLVLMGPIGYSLTGEGFNISTHELAADVAIALGADKLIALVEGKGLSSKGERVSELTTDQAEALLTKRIPKDAKRFLKEGVRASKANVPRVHLISRREPGGLLRELFTRDGVGTIVVRRPVETVRAATSADVGRLLELLAPLEAEGVLVRRPRDLLEHEIERFFVIEREGKLVGCAALYPLAGPDGVVDAAEFASVAISEDARGAGRGDLLLEFAEQRARELGIPSVVVLTTQTAHWFIDRGFEAASLEHLPPSRRKRVDRRRKARVYAKQL